MPEPAGRKRIDPDMAAASRRAAALYTHWARKDISGDGEVAVLRELASETDWVQLVCALLNLTDGLVKAAREGREDAYVAYVLREAMLDEVAGG